MSRKKSEDFYNDCKAAFLSVYDSTTDKITSTSDLALVLQQTGRNPSRKQLSKYWKLDTRQLSYSEFVNICREIPIPSENDLMKAFRKMDVNNDGYVSRQEFMKAMTSKGERMSYDEVATFIEQVDINRDGKLDYKEFCKLILTNVEESKRVSRMKMNQGRTGGQKGNTADRRNSKNGGGRLYANAGSDDDDDLLMGGAKAGFIEEDAVVIEKMYGGRLEYKEPHNLSRWSTVSRRGCFYWEEGTAGKTIISHSYDLNISSHCNVLLTMKPLNILKHSDMKTIVDMGFAIFRGDKVLAISDQGSADGMVYARADLQRGTYRILTFTSGAKMKPRETDSLTKAKLLKQNAAGKIALTTNFKEALADMFTMADLDGNGYLSKSEFSLYNVRTSDEPLDDELWDVVQENCNLVNNEISRDDFIKLNLREAEVDEGSTEGLWSTLDLMGFNHQLMVDEAYPFLMDAYAEDGKEVTLNPRDLTIDNNHLVQDALVDYTLSKGERHDIPGVKDCSVVVYLGAAAAFVVLNNRTMDSRDLKKAGSWIRVDCERSRNLVTSRGMLKKEICIRPGKALLAFHGVAENAQIPITFNGRIEKK